MRALLVEDDEMIGDSIRSALRGEGYVVDWVRDGRMVLTALSTEHFDIVLLDLGLPDKDGLEVLRTVRAAGQTTPVLIITARDAVENRVAGLDCGADDYIVKPFDFDELAARIRSALRRSTGRAEADIEIGAVRFSPHSKQVSRAGHPVCLSAKEYAIVEALLTRVGAILSRAQLEERMYGWGDEIESNAIEVHIHSIRRKLGADFIQNVRGVGYFIPKDAVIR